MMDRPGSFQCGFVGDQLAPVREALSWVPALQMDSSENNHSKNSSFRIGEPCVQILAWLFTVA